MSALFHVVCRSCATAGDDSYADRHETLTRDRVYATLVYGEHVMRGHTVRSLEVSG